MATLETLSLSFEKATPTSQALLIASPSSLIAPVVKSAKDALIYSSIVAAPEILFCGEVEDQLHLGR